MTTKYKYILRISILFILGCSGNLNSNNAIDNVSIIRNYISNNIGEVESIKISRSKTNFKMEVVTSNYYDISISIKQFAEVKVFVDLYGVTPNYSKEKLKLIYAKEKNHSSKILIAFLKKHKFSP